MKNRTKPDKTGQPLQNRPIRSEGVPGQSPCRRSVAVLSLRRMPIDRVPTDSGWAGVSPIFHYLWTDHGVSSMAEVAPECSEVQAVDYQVVVEVCPIHS